MRSSSAALMLLSGLFASAEAFAPPPSAPFFGGRSTGAAVPKGPRTAKSTVVRSLGVDPTHFSDAVHTAFTTFSLADAMEAVADTTTAAVTTAADSAVDAAATTDNGWFGFLTGPTEGLLQIIHSVIAATGVGNAWGVSIIVLTILIKVVTFPLTKTQLESTNKMQAMQPAIKELQAKYQSNPEVMNQKIAEFYQTNEINPLAGCLPSLVQIPVFIGLYRAVLDLAKENQLDEPFLFLPNLEGPTYGADPGTATDWLLKGWVDGTPSMGWDDTLAFLILPIFLVVSQFVSMQLMQPKSDDPAQQQSNAILKVLPIMIGWFALNVPAALSVYWVTNNIITTASSLWIRNTMKVDAPKTPGADGTATMQAPAQTIFTPPREKPAGFGEAPPIVDTDGVKPITAMDAEIVEKVGDKDSDDDGENDAPATAQTSSSGGKKKKRGSKKKKRKN